MWIWIIFDILRCAFLILLVVDNSWMSNVSFVDDSNLFCTRIDNLLGLIVVFCNVLNLDVQVRWQYLRLLPTLIIVLRLIQFECSRFVGNIYCVLIIANLINIILNLDMIAQVNCQLCLFCFVFWCENIFIFQLLLALCTIVFVNWICMRIRIVNCFDVQF